MEPGRAFFMLAPHGMLHFSYCYAGGCCAVNSPSVPGGDLAGGWHMIAVTADVPEKEVAFYLDGALLARRRLPRAAVSEIELGRAVIGRAGDQGKPPDEDRFLRGEIDELMIFRAAISPQEIRHLYELFNPSTRRS
jgi:hypothetical protein